MTRLTLTALGLIATATAAGLAFAATASASKPAPGRVYELRTYVTLPGRLDALNARFRDHTLALFKKHGMENVVYMTPQDDKDGKADTLVYLISHKDREAAKASWAAFQADPDWKAARDASEKDGKIVKGVTSVFLDPTDYSPMK
jgi:NIPSNAP